MDETYIRVKGRWTYPQSLFIDTLARGLARFLSKPNRQAASITTNTPEKLASTLRPGDVLLVEGHSRFSTAIKYLTQSTWSHAALYIGEALGSGEPTRAICSTLIAQAFPSVRYPILPRITWQKADDPAREHCLNEIMHVRYCSLYVPRDFNVSPYFEIVKPTLAQGFNYRAVNWSDAISTDLAPEPFE